MQPDRGFPGEAVEDAPVGEHPAEALQPSFLGGIAIAGPVSSMEELLSVQQIALITRWLRHFSRAATLRAGGRREA